MRWKFSEDLQDTREFLHERGPLFENIFNVLSTSNEVDLCQTELIP